MKGLDISFSEPSQQWWEDRRAEGLEVMVQNLWTGGFASNAGILAVAATNLQRARLAGFRIAGYANASPPDWWSLNIQMGNIRLNAGAEWGNISDVVIDAEIPGITEARVMELADGLDATGKVVDVLYTAHWFWTGHMGNSASIAWRRFRLWPADYDGDATIDFPRPFGPWKLADLVGKQYAGTTRIDGHDVDLNTFEDSWLEDDMTDDMTDEEFLARLEKLLTRAKIPATLEDGKTLQSGVHALGFWLDASRLHHEDAAKHSAGEGHSHNIPASQTEEA